MDHTIEIKTKLTITTQDIVDYVLCCEGGGFDYWAEICCKDEDYEAARKRLIGPDRPCVDLCYEDVLAEILEHGDELTVYDREEDTDYPLNMVILLYGWKRYITETGNADFDKYDANDADGILQYAIFGKWVYG